MTKDEFAKKLSGQTQLSEAEATEFIQAFSKVLSDYFKKGEKVVIAEFGSFFVGENKTVQFNPSAKLKELIGS